MLPRGASSIRGVFLVLARHEMRSRCCGVDRSDRFPVEPYKARSSGPCGGCTLSIPPLARFTCKRPFLKSIWLHFKAQSSVALNPWQEIEQQTCAEYRVDRLSSMTILANSADPSQRACANFVKVLRYGPNRLTSLTLRLATIGLKREGGDGKVPH